MSYVAPVTECIEGSSGRIELEADVVQAIRIARRDDHVRSF
jgi:hypothetical protein